MQQYKYIDISFEDVITHIHEKTNRIEASFSSKLLATITPDNPVWDKNVLTQLSINHPQYYQKDRLETTIKTYYDIEKWYASYLKTQNAQDIIDQFDILIPNILTNVKKIDLVLWSMGVKT
ncbi:MAG: hypothetical protein FWE74_02245 [Oscillospiraceae bacterium]|nr:hypothetical protein [Oscillospiraceae bacterium]